MRFHNALGLLISGSALAFSSPEERIRRRTGTLRNDRSIGPRQNGPVAPDTASDCTYYDTASNGWDTCEIFQDSWGLTFEQFFDYNPSIKADCSGIEIGNSYCVEVNNGLPRPTSVKTTSTAAPTTRTSTPPTGTPKPSPTQAGLIESCTNFYFAVANDNCNKIVALYGTLTYDDFVKWNPAVGPTCDGLWAKTWYCVGIPGTPTAKPTITSPPQSSTQRPTMTVSPKPSPTQEGLITSCTNFYFAVRGDTCAKIVSKYGTFTEQNFVSWNPAVGNDCSGLWAETYYCVGVPGTPTTRPATSIQPTTTGNGVSTPLPTQPGMVTNCNKFHFINQGVSCSQVISYQKITRVDFVKWNPTVGSDCSGMQANVYVCVGVIGGPITTIMPTTTTTKPTTTTTTSGNIIQTPQPTQPGMITLADFVKWNPGVGADCRSMWADTYFCVRV
ncbi:hypothetical protein PTMSG1_10185 [Pyrenophora teres f. maculata]|nr:hypothetical protein PTMSG1_10185 [Pyrenophora teres f. maculata]